MQTFIIKNTIKIEIDNKYKITTSIIIEPTKLSYSLVIEVEHVNKIEGLFIDIENELNKQIVQ